RNDLAVGRLKDRQPLYRRCAARPAREPHVRLGIVAQRRDADASFRRNVEDAGLGIEATGLPERAAGAARVVPGALGAVGLDLGGRREHRAQAILLGHVNGLGAKLGREVDQISLLVALVFIRRRLGRMRLRRPGALARCVARRNWTFLEWPYWLS